MYVNRYSSHVVATESYDNFLRCSFALVQFVLSKFVSLFCLFVCFFLNITIIIGAELVL